MRKRREKSCNCCEEIEIFKGLLQRICEYMEYMPKSSDQSIDWYNPEQRKAHVSRSWNKREIKVAVSIDQGSEHRIPDDTRAVWGWAGMLGTLLYALSYLSWCGSLNIFDPFWAHITIAHIVLVFFVSYW